MGESDQDKAIIAAAFGLIAARGWRGISRADVAAHAGVPLVALYGRFPTKTHFVTRLIDQTDRAVLAEEDTELAEEPVRDRLFDVLMRRFDMLEDYRPGIRALARDLPGDPLSAAMIAATLLGSMGWCLEAAQAGSHGITGAIKAHGLLVIYMDALRVWLEDDDPGRARTMAALDRGLRRAEQAVNRLAPMLRRPRETPSKEAPSDGDVDDGPQTAEGAVG